uniref:Uncharacterized protein n=1 Tax=Panagrolaimus sp. JU765 TaxID=591449 RepID=A0AC34PW37_9BILA
MTQDNTYRYLGPYTTVIISFESAGCAILYFKAYRKQGNISKANSNQTTTFSNQLTKHNTSPFHTKKITTTTSQHSQPLFVKVT